MEIIVIEKKVKEPRMPCSGGRGAIGSEPPLGALFLLTRVSLLYLISLKNILPVKKISSSV